MGKKLDASNDPSQGHAEGARKVMLYEMELVDLQLDSESILSHVAEHSPAKTHHGHDAV